MKTLTTAVFFILLAYLQPTWSEEIKTWTDDEGVTHIEIEGSKPKSDSHKLPSKYILEKKQDMFTDLFGAETFYYMGRGIGDSIKQESGAEEISIVS